MNCLLSFIWKLIDHRFLSNLFIHLGSTFRCKVSLSLIFIVLVPLRSFGSTEQNHCNLIYSKIRLILGFFRTFFEQITISLSEYFKSNFKSGSAPVYNAY